MCVGDPKTYTYNNPYELVSFFGYKKCSGVHIDTYLKGKNRLQRFKRITQFKCLNQTSLSVNNIIINTNAIKLA